MRTYSIGGILFLLILNFIGAKTMTDTPSTIYTVTVEPMKNSSVTTNTLAPYKGQVMLLVNVASKCGYTPQYKALEALNKKYQGQGLRVLGFPCNDFLWQEPGTEEEIVQFCKTKYDVSFPIYAKLHVKGKEQAPLYKYLTGETSSHPGNVKWNFEKFLISRKGEIIGRFSSGVKPDSKEMVEAIEKALNEK